MSLQIEEIEDQILEIRNKRFELVICIKCNGTGKAL